MKFNRIATVEILSRRSMRRPEDFSARLMLHSEMLPFMQPVKWGWWEPISKTWDISDLQKFIPADRGGEADTVIWMRGIKPKAEGWFWTSYRPVFPLDLGVHGSESMNCELSQLHVPPMIDYIQQSMLHLDGDIAFIHFVADTEMLFRRQEDKYGRSGISRLGFGTHTLRHWLPELPWAVVFGQAYVRMFGLERLLTAPAYVVKKLSDEAVYLQLSPKLTDLVDDYAVVDAVRQAVKDHLGRDAFFDVTKAYPLRGPVNERGIYTPEEILNFKPPPPIGTVFRVPDFHLIED